MTVERNYAIAITTLGDWLLLKCSTVGIGFNGAETNSFKENIITHFSKKTLR